MNYILSFILSTLVIYQIYLFITFDDPKMLPLEMPQVVMSSDKISIVKHEPEKSEMITKKEISKLKVSSLKFIGVGFTDNTIYALIDFGKKTRVIRVGDDILGSRVVSITIDELHIEGYKKILFNRPKYTHLGQNKAIKNNSKIPDIVSASEQLQPTKQPTNQSPIRKTSFVRAKPSPTATSDNSKGAKYIVPKAIIKDVIYSPSSIAKYFSFKKELSGISITPKPAYKNLYTSLGFKIGDKIAEVDGKSVNSISLLIGLSNISSAKQLKILVQNAGKYRMLNIDLLKVYKN